MADHPVLRQVALDAVDARGLADFYRQPLGLRWRIGDEPPPTSGPGEQAREWLALWGGPGFRGFG